VRTRRAQQREVRSGRNPHFFRTMVLGEGSRAA